MPLPFAQPWPKSKQYVGSAHKFWCGEINSHVNAQLRGAALATKIHRLQQEVQALRAAERPEPAAAERPEPPAAAGELLTPLKEELGRHKRCSHSDVTLYISLVIIHTKYTGVRQNDSNV
jgi:hypothetical protein